MIGLALRVATLLIATLLLASLTIIGVFYLQRLSESTTEPRAPQLPQRIAAIIALVERAPAVDTELLLRATSSLDFRVELRDEPLAEPGTASEFPHLAALLKRCIGATQPVWIGVGDENKPGPHHPSALLWRKELGGGKPLHIAMQLDDGRVLGIDVRGMTLRRVLGPPFMALAMLLWKPSAWLRYGRCAGSCGRSSASPGKSRISAPATRARRCARAARVKSASWSARSTACANVRRA